MLLRSCLKYSYLLVLLSWTVSSKVAHTVPKCNFKEPITTGNIQDPELVEASGMVASRNYPGVYYSIQDSQNPNNVYYFFENGETLGSVCLFASIY